MKIFVGWLVGWLIDNWFIAWLIKYLGEDWVKKSLKTKASSNNTGLKKQTKIVMAKALEEDPTVFQVFFKS